MIHGKSWRRKRLKRAGRYWPRGCDYFEQGVISAEGTFSYHLLKRIVRQVYKQRTTELLKAMENRK